MANVYGGALAYGISHIKGSIAAWKILFIIEGLPTVALAFVTWWWLPDSIQSTRFLTEREKQVASVFVARNQQADPSGKSGFRWREALLALKEPKSLIPPIFYFGVNVSFASLPLFVPTIIAEMGTFTRIESNGLSAPPYLLTFFTMLLICWLSDRLQLKGPFIVLCTLVAAIGFILLATTTAAASRYVGVFLSIQIFVGVPLILTWVATIHSTESKRAGAQVLMYTIGQMGPLLGTNVFPESQKPYYRKGMWISASMCLMCCFLAILLSTILFLENKKMEREGLIPRKGEEDTYQGAPNTVADEQTGVRRYRYIW